MSNNSNTSSAVDKVLWVTLATLVAVSMIVRSANRNKSSGMEEVIPHLPNGSINVTGYDTEGRVRFNLGETPYTAKPAQELSAENFGPVAGTNLLKMIEPTSIRHARADVNARASGGR